MAIVNLKYNQTVDADIPALAQKPEFVAWAIAFAIRQSAGDADAGKAGTEEGRRAVMEKATRLANGEVPSTGAGGARLGAYDRALRDVVEATLRDWGWKAADAKKAAMEPAQGFENGLRRALAKKLGVPEASVDRANVDQAFDANWPKVEAKAAALAAQAAPVDVEF